jgi:hypothetical protein
MEHQPFAQTLEVVEKKGNSIIVKHPDRETFTEIEDTFAEMFHHNETGHLGETNPFFSPRTLKRKNLSHLARLFGLNFVCSFNITDLMYNEC